MLIATNYYDTVKFMVPNVQGLYKTSRKDAARMLKVSVRTLDRYIDKRIIPSKNIAGRILLNEEDVLNFNKQNRPHKGLQRPAKPAQVPANAIRIDRLNEESHAEAHAQTETGETPNNNGQLADNDFIETIEDRIYRKLYEELKDDVKSFQARLEGANYRVGQLESDLKASVPLVEHQKLLTGHKKEKFNKKILYVVLAVILILQPVWIFLAYF